MKYTWLVEKYLEGELSGEALRKFELEILRKPEVAEEVERVRSMNQFMMEQHIKFQESIGLIEDYEDSKNVIDEEIIRQDLDGLKVRKISTDQETVSDLKTKLTESKVSHTLVNQRSNKVLVRKVSVWLAAASIAILMVFSISLVSKTGTKDYMTAFEENFFAPIADLGERSSESAEVVTPYDRALEIYNEENYEEAFKMLDNIPEESVPNDAYFLYKGITAMKLGNFQAAIESFDHLMTDPVMKHQAIWFTGLSYLAMEDVEKARSVFKDIVNTDGHNKQRRAKKLLRSI